MKESTWGYPCSLLHNALAYGSIPTFWQTGPQGMVVDQWPTMKRDNRVILLFRAMKHWAFMVLLAFMLGLSNVMLQETRMVGDSATRIEQDAEDSDEGPLP